MEADRSVCAVAATLAWFLGIGFPVLAVNYALGGTGGGVLQVLGAAHIDAAALYLLLCGWRAAAPCAPAARDVLRATLPDTALSGALHLALQAVRGDGGDWANAALAPLLLAGFADVRDANVLRGPSETAWLVHAQTLLALAGGAICAQLRCASAAGAVRSLALAWAASAVHVYIAAAHTRLATAAVRNVFTCASLFSAGALVGLFSGGAFEWADSARARLAQGVPAGAVAAAGAAVVALYLLHLTDSPTAGGPCVSVFGGAPCLWALDAFNGRLLPLFALALAWATGPAEPWLGGPLAAPLSEPLRHVAGALAACVDDGRAQTWLLYGGLLALAVHAPAAAVPGAARYACVLVPVELALATLLAGALRRVSAARFAAAFDAIAGPAQYSAPEASRVGHEEDAVTACFTIGEEEDAAPPAPTAPVAGI